MSSRAYSPKTVRTTKIQDKTIVIKKLSYIALFLVICLLGFFIFKGIQFYQTIQTGSHTKPTVKQKPPEEKTVYNFLILGYGGGNHEGTYLTDTIIVAQLDLKKKKATLISIPRDLWVKIPTNTKEDFHAKINGAYEMGLFPKEYPAIDPKLTANGNSVGVIKYAINEITGLQIDSYIAIDFQGFVKTVDVLDGVDVVVDKTFSDPEYPIDGKEDDTCDKKDKDLEDALKIATEDARLAFPCRYETLHFDKGPVHLTGEEALKYARSRHSLQDGGDFARATRQQKVIEAVKAKMLSIGFLPKIIPLMDELKNHIKTDIDSQDLAKFLTLASHANDYEIAKLVFSNSNYLKDSFSDRGQYILVSEDGIDQWDSVKRIVNNTILRITPTPTPTITPTPTKVIKKPIVTPIISPSKP